MGILELTKRESSKHKFKKILEELRSEKKKQKLRQYETGEILEHLEEYLEEILLKRRRRTEIFRLRMKTKKIGEQYR